MTNEEFVEKVNQKFNGRLKPLTEYAGTNKDVWFENLDTDDPIKRYVRVSPNHLFTRGLPKYNRIKDTDELKTRVKILTGDEYSVLGEYVTGKTKIMFRHSICGNEFEMRPEDFLNGQRCPKCARKIAGEKHRKTLIQFENELTNLVGDEYTLLSEYKTNKDKVLMRHNICGKTFEVAPSSFLFSNGQRDKGTRCPYCYGTPKKTDEEIAKKISECDKDYSFVPGTYINAQTQFLVKHLVCGKSFKSSVHNFVVNGQRCPHCAYISTSKKEKEVADFVKTICDDVKENIRFYKDETKKKEFIEADILLEKEKIVIEFDGIYWHSVQQGKDSNYHRSKTRFFNDLGYRVIHIFEDEWEYKKDIVKSKLKHILNKDDRERVFARKCSIKELTSAESKEFFDANHLQGNVNARDKVGLFYNNELVAAISFGKVRKALGFSSNNDKEVELLRYATNKNVIGGFSRLLKYCIEKYQYETIMTYADLRWSSSKSNIYQKTGFNFIRECRPNYFYYDGLKRFNRFNFRKNILKDKFPELYDEKLTEFEIMDKTKYLRVYDCGTLVYSMQIKKD